MDEAQIDLIRESFSSLVNHPCFIAICEPNQNVYKWHYQGECISPPQSCFNQMKFDHLEDELKQKIKYLKDLQGTIKAKFENIFILLQNATSLDNKYLEELASGTTTRYAYFEIRSVIQIQDEIFNLIIKNKHLNQISTEELKQYVSQIELYLNRNRLHFEMSIQSLIEQMSSLLKNN